MEKEIHTFKLDPFQEEAIAALKKGVSVVVSAPTSAGLRYMPTLVQYHTESCIYV